MAHAHFSNVEYRVGCGSNTVPQFGNCYTSPITSGVGLVPEFINQTRVEDYALDPVVSGIAPYPRKGRIYASCAGGNPDCDTPGLPLCDAWIGTGLEPKNWLTCPAETSAQIDFNCYKATTGKIDYRLCRKIGFKNVQARKVWHGRFGFMSHDPLGCLEPPQGADCNYCSYEDEQLNPDTTKYLRIRREVSVSVSCFDFNCNNYQDHYSYVREYRVDKNAGTITMMDCYEDTGTFASGVCDAIGPCGDWVPAKTWAVSLIGLDACGGRLYGTTGNETSTLGNPIATVTNTQISVESHGTCTVPDQRTPEHPEYCPEMNGSYDISCTITLSEPYTAAEVQSEVTSLLSLWPLNDDILYPWRTDEYGTIAPLVTRNERSGPVSPDIITPCTVDDGSGNQIPWTDDNALIYDGSIRGAPLPRGYRNHFDWRHTNWGECVTPDGDEGWYTESYGAQSAANVAGDLTDTLVPLGATQWTEQFEATNYFPWAWAQFQGATLTAQKWCETLVKRPSYNFARPCGEDRYNFDETTVRCITGLTTGASPVVSVDVFYEQAPAIVTNDSVLVCGSDDSVNGGWRVTKLNDNDYELSQRLFSFPSGYESPVDCEGGLLGKLRFPNAPAICGKIKVIGASNAAPIVLGFNEDTWLRDGDKIVVEGVQGNTAANGYFTAQVRGPREIQLSGTTGNAEYTRGGFAHTRFAADEKFNDVESKGEYSFLEWGFNYRDVGETDRLSGQYIDCNGCAEVSNPPPLRMEQLANGFPREVNSFTCSTHCLPYKNCAPSVIAITPNGETFTNGKNHGFGTITLDSRYGSLWQAQIKQHITDPLWQTPHKPCVSDESEHTQHVDWRSDDGTCNPDTTDPESLRAIRYYPLGPFVEARCELPIGAPLMPQGIYMGCVTLAQLQEPSMPSGIVCFPPNPVGHLGKYPRTTTQPWGVYLRELSCVCGNVRPDFVDDYQANGVDCKEEVPPP